MNLDQQYTHARAQMEAGAWTFRAKIADQATTIARLTAALTDIMGILTAAHANADGVTCLWMDIKYASDIGWKMRGAYDVLKSVEQLELK